MSDSDDPIFKLVNDLPGTSVTGRASRSRLRGARQWKNIRASRADQRRDWRAIRALVQQSASAPSRSIPTRRTATIKPSGAFRWSTAWTNLRRCLGRESIGQKFEPRLLEEHHSRAQTAQAIDAANQVACELASFRFVNGFPGDSVGEFAKSLGGIRERRRDSPRPFVAIDCCCPSAQLPGQDEQRASGASLTDNKLFNAVSKYLPEMASRVRMKYAEELAGGPGVSSPTWRKRGASNRGASSRR